MKRLGVIGGMSWESTQTYYRLLNEEIKARCVQETHLEPPVEPVFQRRA